MHQTKACNFQTDLKRTQPENESILNSFESDVDGFENELNEDSNGIETDLKYTQLENESISKPIELPINRPTKHSPTIKSTNLAVNDAVGDVRVKQLIDELKFITDGKKRITDPSKLGSIDRHINSLVSQLGAVGYDVEFEDASETEFTITKF